MKRFTGRMRVVALALAVASAPVMAGGHGGGWGGGGGGYHGGGYHGGYYGGNNYHHHGGGGSSSAGTVVPASRLSALRLCSTWLSKAAASARAVSTVV